jgi:hypothetical protein
MTTWSEELQNSSQETEILEDLYDYAIEELPNSSQETEVLEDLHGWLCDQRVTKFFTENLHKREKLHDYKQVFQLQNLVYVYCYSNIHCQTIIFVCGLHNLLPVVVFFPEFLLGSKVLCLGSWILWEIGKIVSWQNFVSKLTPHCTWPILSNTSPCIIFNAPTPRKTIINKI